MTDESTPTPQPRPPKDPKRNEEEIRRRVAAALSNAGVPLPTINTEVLYMLPPEFVQAYTALYDAALKDPMVGSGSGRGIGPGGSPGVRGAKRDGAIRDSGKGGRPRAVVQPAQGSGRRYKTHWVVKSEAALKAKASLDRRLRRLASDVLWSLEHEERGAIGPTPELWCRNEHCRMDLTNFSEALGKMLRFCPRCGVAVRVKRPHPT